MVTQAEIDRHDRLIDRLARQFGVLLTPVLREFFDELAALEAPTRIQIQQLFNRFRILLRDQLTVLPQLIESNIQMTGSVLDPTITGQVQDSINRLTSEVEASVNQQLDEEQNSIINAIIFGSIAGVAFGATLPSIVRELRKTASKIVDRIKRSFNTALRNFDGALTLIRGRLSGRDIRYRYAGGVIAETRPFCRSMNGRTFTEEEIRKIWNNQTWQGKRPGDPFVVRGGYNCRHMFVPVANTEES